MVEFIYRCGDITSSSNGTLSKEAMNAGSKMHRKLQKMAGSYYDAEVPLKITMKKGIHDLDVTVEGRADGIIDLRGEKNRSRKKKEIERQVIRVEDRYWNRLLLKKTESLDLEVGEDFMEQNSAGTIGQMQEMNEPADVTIDEIKGVYRKLADIAAKRHTCFYSVFNRCLIDNRQGSGHTRAYRAAAGILASTKFCAASTENLRLCQKFCMDLKTNNRNI